MTISRRALLLGGAGGVVVVAAGGGYELVEARVLPGKVRLDRALGRCGSVPPSPPWTGHVSQETFYSRRRGRNVNAITVLPAGVTSIRGLPVVVGLHGEDGRAGTTVHSLALPAYLPYVVAKRNVAPFAVVAVDGGANTYWHPRADGDDPIAMITDELLPRLAARGARTSRIGAIGYSMGGYGALVLAETVGAPRMAAVVASSPAIFPSYANARHTNAVAFDSAADFARNDVTTHAGRLRGVAIEVDYGGSDPFAPSVGPFWSKLVRSGLHPVGGESEGCHDGAFWQRHIADQLTFLGRHL